MRLELLGLLIGESRKYKMNWLFYIPGGIIFLGWVGSFWRIEEHINKKEYFFAIFKLICLTCIWIWFCWKLNKGG